MKSYEKLVRDGIQDVITNNGEYYYTRKLKPEEFVVELNKKLLEEAHEVEKATTKEELIEELADVLEVIKTIEKANNVKIDDIEIINDKSLEDSFLMNGLTRNLINEIWKLKKDPSELEKSLLSIKNILLKIMSNNNITYEDVENARIEKREKRGGFDRRVFLKSTITREEMAKIRGCRTCVNKYCTHNWYLLNGPYEENGEPAGKFCINYISNYRQRKK